MRAKWLAAAAAGLMAASCGAKDAADGKASNNAQPAGAARAADQRATLDFTVQLVGNSYEQNNLGDWRNTELNRLFTGQAELRYVEDVAVDMFDPATVADLASGKAAGLPAGTDALYAAVEACKTKPTQPEQMACQMQAAKAFEAKSGGADAGPAADYELWENVACAGRVVVDDKGQSHGSDHMGGPVQTLDTSVKGETQTDVASLDACDVKLAISKTSGTVSLLVRPGGGSIEVADNFGGGARTIRLSPFTDAKGAKKEGAIYVTKAKRDGGLDAFKGQWSSGPAQTGQKNTSQTTITWSFKLKPGP